jgi:hypothetical protein
MNTFIVSSKTDQMKKITSILLFCIAFQANAQKALHGQRLLDSLKKSYDFNKLPALKKKIDSLEGLLYPPMVRLKKTEAGQSIEELENPYNIEERSQSAMDYSVLKNDTGFLNIGEYRINLSRFTNYKQESIIKSLSFPDSLVYIAIVSNRGDDSFDTTIIRGKKPDPLLIKKLQRKPTEIDAYAWQELSRKQGFGNDCPPGNCTHYFIAITSTKRLIKVSNPDDLLKILPRLKTGNDAYFHIVKNDYWPRGKYAKTKNGFLVLLNEKISNCPIDYADVLYQVDYNGKLVQLGRVITQKTMLCH